MNENLLRCCNSLDGQHKWLERSAKNKNKPEQCVLCNQLKVDLEYQYIRYSHANNPSGPGSPPNSGSQSGKG